MGFFTKRKEKKKDVDLEKTPKRNNYFNYTGEMPDDVKSEIDRVFRMAVQIFGIKDPTDGKAIASEIRRIVDDILKTGSFPSEYADIEDVAVALGVMFGQALCCGYGWTWKVFGDSEQKAMFGVVSPEENFCNVPMQYLLKILKKQNIGLDGKNDNTVLLLYNMLENIDQRPEREKYIPLA